MIYLNNVSVIKFSKLSTIWDQKYKYMWLKYYIKNSIKINNNNGVCLFESAIVKYMLRVYTAVI